MNDRILTSKQVFEKYWEVARWESMELDPPEETLKEIAFKAWQARAAHETPASLPAQMRAKGDDAYCAYIEQMRKPECLGWEAKVKSGQFGVAELTAHTKAAELFGIHKGYHLASQMLERLQQETEVRPCTCHPDDDPPRPCPQKFALSECRAAAGVCRKHGKHSPGVCPKCDELAEARMIVSTVALPPSKAAAPLTTGDSPECNDEPHDYP